VIGSDLDDVIKSNTKVDTFTGGDGADTFSFVTEDANNVVTEAKAKVITDFVHASDVIELDTDTAFTADQYSEGSAASFTAALTFAKAQMTSTPEDNLVAVQVGSDVFVFVDMNDGDKVDLAIKLTGVSTAQLNFADFAFV
jgi:hypothetical protein